MLPVGAALQVGCAFGSTAARGGQDRPASVRFGCTYRSEGRHPTVSPHLSLFLPVVFSFSSPLVPPSHLQCVMLTFPSDSAPSDRDFEQLSFHQQGLKICRTTTWPAKSESRLTARQLVSPLGQKCEILRKRGTGPRNPHPGPCILLCRPLRLASVSGLFGKSEEMRKRRKGP